jgi:hypothetical protein
MEQERRQSKSRKKSAEREQRLGELSEHGEHTREQQRASEKKRFHRFRAPCNASILSEVSGRRSLLKRSRDFLRGSEGLL